jgi:hypothetical protein
LPMPVGPSIESNIKFLSGYEISPLVLSKGRISSFLNIYADQLAILVFRN